MPFLLYTSLDKQTNKKKSIKKKEKKHCIIQMQIHRFSSQTIIPETRSLTKVTSIHRKYITGCVSEGTSKELLVTFMSEMHKESSWYEKGH